jgi:hypothetical protein
MNKVKYFQNIINNGIEYSTIMTNYLILEYNNIDINNNLRTKIKNSIAENSNFEIPISDFKPLLNALERRVEELLKHHDFNPFKEKLREQFPEQYGSQPFEYKGTTYYLYHKGREFYIDSLIYGVLGFKELIEEHIKSNKPLKYVYKE